MTRDQVALLAVLIVVLVPLMWARAKMDRLHSDAAKRVFRSWGRAETPGRFSITQKLKAR